MKMRQLKKILSITLASAMLITSVPSGTFASESETLPTEQTSETGSGNEETGSGEQGSGSEETGSGET
ncbi:MAG: hypothetical protein Q4E91_14230, partial [Lachnospiraceae bacterium]|nr:hypothetical protein [Lachnospiraceae bacterium]